MILYVEVFTNPMNKCMGGGLRMSFIVEHLPSVDSLLG